MRGAILIAFNFGIFIVANGKIGEVISLQNTKSKTLKMECANALQKDNTHCPDKSDDVKCLSQQKKQCFTKAYMVMHHFKSKEYKTAKELATEIFTPVINMLKKLKSNEMEKREYEPKDEIKIKDQIQKWKKSDTFQMNMN